MLCYFGTFWLIYYTHNKIKCTYEAQISLSLFLKWIFWPLFDRLALKSREDMQQRASGWCMDARLLNQWAKNRQSTWVNLCLLVCIINTSLCHNWLNSTGFILIIYKSRSAVWCCVSVHTDAIFMLTLKMMSYLLVRVTVWVLLQPVFNDFPLQKLRGTQIFKGSCWNSLKTGIGYTGALQVPSSELHIHNNFACATVSNLCSPLYDCNISSNTNSVGVFKLTFLADLVTDRHLAPTPLCWQFVHSVCYM